MKAHSFTNKDSQQSQKGWEAELNANAC